MAEIKIDHGWLKFVHELFAAIACAGFAKWEWIVLREVFDQVYGVQKRETAHLSPSDIAGRIGTHRESIGRAIRTLMGHGVLVRMSEGEYAFVKDYDRWTLGFSEQEIAYIKTAKPSVKSKDVRNDSAPVKTSQCLLGFNENSSEDIQVLPEQLRSGDRSAGAPGVERRRSAPGAPALQVRSAGAPVEGVPPRPPIEEPARLKNNKESKESTALPRTHVIALAGEPEPTVGRCPEYPIAERSMLMIMPNEHPVDEESARSIWDGIWHQWHQIKLCNGFYEHQRWFTPGVWRAAIREAIRRDKTPNSIRYIEEIAGDYATHGIPEEKPPSSTHVSEYQASHRRPNVVPPRSAERKQRFRDSLPKEPGEE